MKLRCLRNGFLFAFLQNETAHGLFEEKTAWGFTMTPGSYLRGKDNPRYNDAMQKARWAKVLTIGPECEEVEVGDYVCVEPTMYTNAFVHDGIKIRKSDESKVMLISKEKPNVFV